MAWRGMLSLIAGMLMMLAGCASHAERLYEVRSHFYAGRLDLASAKIEEHMKRRLDKEDDVFLLDQAIIDLSAGRAKQAEQTLRAIRDRFDHLEQKDAAETVLAMATDDTQLAYAGEDYEKVLLRAFLAISNLMHDGGDVRAYALQMAEKQRQIIAAAGGDNPENPKRDYKLVALGPYLHGAILEDDPLGHSEALRCREVVCRWEPSFAYGQNDLQRALYGRHSEPGHGVVYVFTLVGRGPYKEEVNELPTQVAMLLADRIISATSKYSLTPTLAPVKVPRVVGAHNRIRSVLVLADGRPQGRTATVTDVTDLAIQQYQAVYPQVLARAVVRRTLKKGTLYVAKDLLDVNPYVSLAIDVGGVVWEATESADTRCWGLLPDQIQVLRLELPAGEHRIELQASDGASPIGPAYSHAVQVLDGRNTYLLANFPNERLVGEILSSAR